jgi:hypothetical protein
MDLSAFLRIGHETGHEMVSWHFNLDLKKHKNKEYSSRRYGRLDI